jgi:hypothetical protein
MFLSIYFIQNIDYYKWFMISVRCLYRSSFFLWFYGSIELYLNREKGFSNKDQTNSHSIDIFEKKKVIVYYLDNYMN